MMPRDILTVITELRATICELERKDCEVSIIINSEAVSVDINHCTTQEMISFSTVIFNNSDKDDKIKLLTNVFHELAASDDVVAVLERGQRIYKQKYII